MFHSQLVGGTSIQFKTVGESVYLITQQDIGKTLRFGQSTTITIGQLSVVDGSLVTIENTGNFVVTVAGVDDVVVQGGTISVPASSSTSLVKTSNNEWKQFSSGSGGGSGSGVNYKGLWSMAPAVINDEMLNYDFDGALPDGAGVIQFPTHTPNSGTMITPGGDSPQYGAFSQHLVDLLLLNQDTGGLNLAASVSNVARPIQYQFNSNCPAFPTGQFPHFGIISWMYTFVGKDVITNDQFTVQLSILTGTAPLYGRKIGITGSGVIGGTTTYFDTTNVPLFNAHAYTDHRVVFYYVPETRNVGIILDGNDLGLLTKNNGNGLVSIQPNINHLHTYVTAASSNVNYFNDDPSTIGSEFSSTQTINVANIVDPAPSTYTWEQWGDITVIPAAKPNGTSDGDLYKVTDSGTVSGVFGYVDDYMLFVDNTSKIIPIRDLNEDFVNTQISANLEIGGSIFSHIETRLDPIESDVASLQADVANVAKNAKLLTENITGVEGSPTIIVLNETDNGNLKRIIWTNQTTYDIQFASYSAFDPWFHFYFMLDMPVTNEDYHNDIHILITVGSDIVADYYFDSNRMKYQIWEYSCGQIRAISTRQTNFSTPQNRPNPGGMRSKPVDLYNGYNDLALNYSSYDRFVISPQDDITGASISVITLARGTMLRHTFYNGIYIEVDGTTHSVAGLTIDGITCPTVPQGETHKFIFYPYHGGFVRLG